LRQDGLRVGRFQRHQFEHAAGAVIDNAKDDYADGPDRPACRCSPAPSSGSVSPGGAGGCA
jgi:hypothetical protein